MRAKDIEIGELHAYCRGYDRPHLHRRIVPLETGVERYRNGPRDGVRVRWDEDEGYFRTKGDESVVPAAHVREWGHDSQEFYDLRMESVSIRRDMERRLEELLKESGGKVFFPEAVGS